MDDLDDEVEDDKTRPFSHLPARPLNPLVPPFKPGDLVASKYRVDEVLGCGGMAWVLRATHVQLNQKVALKFLRFATSGEAVARFFHEGRAAARVSSDAVTRVLDVDTLPDGQPFLVMEYLDGRDLEKVVGDPGLLPIATAADFAIQACEGLAEVHAAGIVHRDLKPANLFLTRKRNGSIRMKLLDFGISKFAAGGPFIGNESPLTSTQALMGSPVYMAPEQMRSSKNVDARADIWSLGVILYELLAGGRSPFQGETLPEVCMRVMRETPEPLTSVRTDVPPGLLAVVGRCLEKDPARRFSSAAALAIALGPFASNDGQRLVRRLQRRASGPSASDQRPPPDGPRPPPPAPAIAPGATLRLTSLRPSQFPRASRPTPCPAPPIASRPSSATRVSTRGSEPSSVDVPAHWVAFAMRHAVTTVALFGLLVGVAAASFAFGIRMSVERRAAMQTLIDATPRPSVGVTDRMPAAAWTAPSPTLPPPVSLAPPPDERVYTPEELPLAPSSHKLRKR
jgi:serine/threonine-protein kinase